MKARWHSWESFGRITVVGATLMALGSTACSKDDGGGGRAATSGATGTNGAGGGDATGGATGSSSVPGALSAGAFMRGYLDRVSALSVNCGLTPLGPAIRDLHSAAVDSGRTSYDAAYASACLKELEGVACMDFLMFEAVSVPSCGKALRGKAAEGGPCYMTIECAMGQCVLEAGSCPGTCRSPAFASKGADCSVDMCGFGLACADGRCEPRGATAGAPCGRLVDCGKGFYCGKPFGCGSGDICSLMDVNTCKPRKHVGEACGQEKDIEVEYACDEGLRCAGAAIAVGGNGATTVVAGVCQPTADEGGPCRVPTATATIMVTGCRAGLVCSAGVCVSPPAVGSTCSGVLEAQCSHGYCDKTTNTCTPYLEPGAPCQSAECEYGCMAQDGSTTARCNAAPWCAPP